MTININSRLWADFLKWGRGQTLFVWPVLLEADLFSTAGGIVPTVHGTASTRVEYSIG